jgi:ABC-2 type transport system permease protein
MEALLSTTLTRFELLAGKVIPYFVLGMLSMTLCVLISVFFYGLPFRGSVWLLGVVSSLFLLCALGFGLLISTISRNQVVAYQIAIVAGFLPAFILSGFLFEITSMPVWVQILTYFIPARYFVTSLQTLFLVGNVWPLILRSILMMLLIATLFFSLAIRKTVKRLD